MNIEYFLLLAMGVIAFFLRRTMNDFDTLKKRLDDHATSEFRISERQSIVENNYKHLEESLTKVEDQLSKLTNKIDELLKTKNYEK